MTASLALVNPKWARNVGAAIRSASCLADGPTEVMFTGSRVEEDIAAANRMPREERMKAYAEVPWRRVAKPIDERPDLVPVAVELLPGAVPLPYFVHPEHALYVFGPEDGSLPAGIRAACHHFVVLPTRHCLNLATAVTVTLYDRAVKRAAEGLDDLPFLDETRGAWHTTALEALG